MANIYRIAEAKRLRDLAENCRMRSDHAGSDDARRCWLEMASSYDLMATQETELAVMVMIGTEG